MYVLQREVVDGGIAWEESEERYMRGWRPGVDTERCSVYITNTRAFYKAFSRLEQHKNIK